MALHYEQVASLRRTLSRSQAHDYQFKLCERSARIKSPDEGPATSDERLRKSTIKGIFFRTKSFLPCQAAKNKMLREAFKEKVLQSDKSVRKWFIRLLQMYGIRLLQKARKSLSMSSSWYADLNTHALYRILDEEQSAVGC
ncbi:hypothetical protein GWK47_020844 [Chionoecetes opilio]|uniref:Uncharacterized protein n=1 Tax=Chionoecetes opilio TaxID=41210 RepID=A0A8J5CKP2_CHIOP|nr:hypothetical protein GWK47_020844 [Chionoecetes opilio]